VVAAGVILAQAFGECDGRIRSLVLEHLGLPNGSALSCVAQAADGR
jgi:hypothetical protein